MVQAAVIGARGYLGRETVRLLLAHPGVEEVLPISRSAAGQPFGDHVPTLRHVGLTIRDEDAAADADVLFLATPKGEAARFVQLAQEQGARCVIDLSRDHRSAGIHGEAGWRYGLADHIPVPRGTPKVANPGCYPTATLTALMPAIGAGLLDGGAIIADGKSGVSGAGVAPRPDLHFAAMEGSVRAYKVEGHDHTEEMRLQIAQSERRDDAPRPVRFTPHLVPQTRGLLATVYAPLKDGVTTDDAAAAYAAHYRQSAFVRTVPEPDTAHVRGGNHADVAVHADGEAGLLVARCAIDNLLKGGAGQAVQNMNDALGLPPATGLEPPGCAL